LDVEDEENGRASQAEGVAYCRFEPWRDIS
jgi:hypothetical protein